MSDTLVQSADSQENRWTYARAAGFWDEALLPSGLPRRHWRKLFAEIRRIGVQQLNRRWQAGQTLIQTHGVTYNLGNLPAGNEYPWPMDPIPLIIDEKEWFVIEEAIAQRATLLNAILLDFYGKQRLLHDRLVPAALVFENPHFLRPCFGVTPPGGVHLLTYAADLARSADGRWWVIADRTQAPAGMGYTLQNRLVGARTFPGIFDQYHVRQLARFFDGKREALIGLASTLRANPNIVVLTPGPHNETFFEHSFLAGQWGFTLVEGADLTVLDRRVYLKTLGGLKPVDLILRRLDDAFGDPLELRGDSLLGVPGLVDAARAGNVAIDNALGSGLVETTAHMPFLPGLCRQLLGEDLRLPSVATWWCGQDEPRRYALEHLRKLVVKPAFPNLDLRTEFPEAMTDSELRKLKGRIEGRPEEFVAQERVALSTIPVRTDRGFAPRHAVLRVYAAWNGSSYSVMSGGLTRVSNQDSSLVVSMQLGGASKDTWVLGSAEETATVRRSSSSTIGLQPVKAELPSRVADNLFWLGRYTERVEARVRFVRALLPALSGEQDFGRAVSLETATRLLAGMRYLPDPLSPSVSLGEQRRIVMRILTEMVYDVSQTSGLRWNLKELRRSVWPLKERLSSDTWRVIQQLDAEFSALAPANSDQRYVAAMDLLDGAILTLSAFSGLLMENTTRGVGWRFLEIGRRMERALQMAALLQSGLASAAPAEVESCLKVLLQIADSSITYRSRYPLALQTDLVIGLLLADETNPRSVGFQLASLAHQLMRLMESDNAGSGRFDAPIAEALKTVRESNLLVLAKRNPEGNFEALGKLIDELKATLWTFSDRLTERYLIHLTPSPLTVSW